MMALKLKDRWDEYKQVPSEEDGLGPVHLRSPVDGTSPYHDDDDVATLRGIDTEIPGARTSRKRSKKDCCMCCGLRCGYFWKAFGIVCLIFFSWQIVKLAIWAIKPSPTGLEGMPTYSTSLGCGNGKFTFTNSYEVAVNAARADHAIDLRGAAVGTLVIAQGSEDSTHIQFQVNARTNEESLLTSISVTHPDNDNIEEGLSNSELLLQTAPHIPTGSSCIRFDATLYVPPQVKKLHIQAHSTTHIKFAELSHIYLDTFFVTMWQSDVNNMLLPSTGIHANEMALEMTRGWLVGDVNLGEMTTITTQRGDATTNLKIHPEVSNSGIAQFQTTTGAGRSDLFYVSDVGAPHRVINAVHRSSRGGDLYLRYKDAEFSGTVDMEAKSYTATGVQGLGPSRNGTDLPWVGDKEGSDKLKIQSIKGWVGLYF